MHEEAFFHCLGHVCRRILLELGIINEGVLEIVVQVFAFDLICQGTD